MSGIENGSSQGILEPNNRTIEILPGQTVVISSPQELLQKPKGEVSQLSRTRLLFLAVNFGSQIYNSELGADTEFGNIRSEREAADPTVRSLRDDEVTTLQVRDVLLDIAEGYSVRGLATRSERIAWANRVTVNLKKFADQTLPSPEDAESVSTE